MKTLTLLIVVAAVVSGCKKEDDGPDLRLVSDVRVAPGEFGLTYLIGDIVNRGDHGISLVWINIALFDSSGRQVGNAFDSTSNLQEGVVWHFRALAVENFSTFTVTEINGI